MAANWVATVVGRHQAETVAVVGWVVVDSVVLAERRGRRARKRKLPGRDAIWGRLGCHHTTPTCAESGHAGTAGKSRQRRCRGADC